MKRLFVLFIVLALPCGAVFSQKKDIYRVRTVVIDPGHGGAKPGAQGSRSWEKDITLSVAKKFGQLIKDNYPDVKLIYTRTTDVDISLAERARIANRNKADLFISIHANSHPTSAPTGVETFVMGLSESKANLEVAKKENADILLEADYKNNADYSGFDPNAPETYVMLAMFQNAFIDKSLNLAQAIQNQYKQNLKTINRGVKQAELYVLYKTTCPSVLTEIGFISNHTEESFMLSDEGQAKIAVSLFRAFMNYKSAEEGTAKLGNPVINIKGWKQEGGEKKAESEKPVTVQEEKAEVADAQPQVADEKLPAASGNNEVQKDTQEVQAPTGGWEEKTEAKSEPQPAVMEASKAVAVGKPTPSAQLPAVKQVEPKPMAEQPKVEQPKQEQPKAPSKPEQPKSPVASEQPKQPKAPATPEHPKQSKTESKSQQTSAAQQGAAGVRYRVQFCTATRDMKPGDPDLHGIKDIHVARSGKYYMYTAGDYTTLAEARQRCKKIKETSTFRDAFVIAIYRGERITLDRAAQIESQNQKKK